MDPENVSGSPNRENPAKPIRAPFRQVHLQADTVAHPGFLKIATNRQKSLLTPPRESDESR
jgi:hypothetical protein